MKYEVKAGTKLFTIIETVQRLDEPTLSKIAADLDFPKSTTHNYLKTLEENGYLIDHDGVYQLSLKFLDHGVHAKRKLRIARKVPPVLDQLSADTNEAAWLMVEERGYCVGVEKALGERAVQTSGRIGRHTRLHYHAPGKAILSKFPQDRVDDILNQQGLPQKTENTITDYDELMSELETIREHGVAFDVGEAISGIRSVAAPVVCEGVVEGAVAVVGPKNRLKGERFRQEIADLVSGAANELELRLLYDD
ncbi:IclR family transcriptional regulator [Natronosalvus halobius]|uniref:IclR family transcriptional regulator n=1 Tax=Natronosalvus halobius TaxID=2953746 RepID=UPI00209DA12D|nr:IclR family transcriptional regulator [Natronosalvus halobius]USZ73618.1 IclR family transcriptional regulator [Natronosalvus halobius]